MQNTSRACRACLLILALLLLIVWYALGALRLRAEVFGHTHAALAPVAAALGAGLYAPDVPLLSRGCPATFNITTGFQDGGPRLWLWWTPPVPGALPSSGGDFLARCFESVARHAPPLLRVAVVNSSATRGPDAPYPLRRFPLPPYFDALPWNHQGDFGSFAVLAEYGGVYLDTDVLLLHSLEPYVRLLERSEFFGFGGHSYDEGVHHGLMAARPGARVLARAYAAALAVYEAEGGCAGATCANVGGLRWLSTLDAFSSVVRGLVAQPCAYARLPTRHFEPGTVEHEDMCAPALNEALTGSTAAAAVDPSIIRYLAATLSAAASGVLRAVHMSTTKGNWGRAVGFEGCALVKSLWGVSMGKPDMKLIRSVTGRAAGTWNQVAGNFMPLER